MCSTVVAVRSGQTACMDSPITEGQTESKLSVKGLSCLSIFISCYCCVKKQDNVRGEGDEDKWCTCFLQRVKNAKSEIIIRLSGRKGDLVGLGDNNGGKN